MYLHWYEDFVHVVIKFMYSHNMAENIKFCDNVISNAWFIALFELIYSLQISHNYSSSDQIFLTLKAPITTAADDIHKYLFIVFRKNKTWCFKWILC